MLPFGDGVLTYSYAFILFGIALLLVISRHTLNWSNGFLAAPFVLALIGCIALIHARSLSPPPTTYSSALIPLLICALPVMVERTDIWLDCRAITKFLLFAFVLTSFCHLAWQFSSLAGVEVYPSLEQTFTFCFVIVLTGLAGREIMLMLVCLGVISSLAIRPTSTLFVGATVSLAFVVAYRFRMRRSLRFVMISMVALMLLVNLGILSSAGIADAVYSAEPYLKQSVLNAQTDNDFRLGVIDALRQATESSSVLFGEYFSGDINPIVTDVLPWWYDVFQTDDAPIHSDFLIMLSQGGLAGYILFATLLLGFARLCLKGARLSASIGETELERFFDSALAMEVIFCFYTMFNPIMQKPYLAALFLVLVPICVFLMRGLEQALLMAQPVRPRLAFVCEAPPAP